MMSAPVLDLTRICRACKCESLEMHQLFNGNDNNIESPRIDEMLMACTSIQMNRSDGLPTLLCNDCKEKVEYAYTFKQQCLLTDISLREYAKRVKKEADMTDNFLDDLEEMLDTDTDAANKRTNVKLEEMSAAEMESTVLKCDFIEIMENNQLVLTCRQCYKVFTTLDGLKCHKRMHSGALYKCKTCDKEYTRLNHLQRHELSHGRKKVHVCKICNKTLTRFEHLKRHLVTHLKEKPFNCEKCNRGFNRLEHLVNHTERCKGDRVHICDICNKGFNRADSLEVHRRLHENKMPVLPTLENLDNIDEHYIEIDYDESYNSMFDMYDDELDGDETDMLEPQIHITENPDTFEECNVDPINDEADDDNIKTEISNEVNILQDNTNVKCDGEGFLQDECPEYINPEVENDSDSGCSEYTPTKVTRKIKRGRGRPRKLGLKRGRPPKIKVEEIKIEEFEDEEGEFSCLVCNEIFTKLSLLDVHASSHEGVKVFECKTCQKTFSRSTHLKRHMLTHSEIKPYSCDLCTKSFSRRDHLTQHMKLHSRALEYECDICQRTFARVDHLTKHQLAKHNQSGDRVIGEKRFKCSVCSKGFTTEKYRDVHMKAHNGEKKFQCKTCDKSFLSKSHLTEHMKFHSDHSKKFLCSECGQRFIRNDYLIIHMRRHRGEKPFKCKFCGKGFPRTTDLTVHERYHTGEKTHLCVICGRGFGRAYNLTVHMRTHTGEKPYQCTYCQAAFAQGNDLKAHIRRHTGERFQCELCTETFLMGYLLTQHKRQVHGLNVVSNIRRLQTGKQGNPEDEPITITLPAPVVPSTINVTQLQAQLAIQLQHPIVE